MPDPEQVALRGHGGNFLVQAVIVPVGCLLMGLALIVGGVVLDHFAPLLTGVLLTPVAAFGAAVGVSANRPTLLNAKAVRQRRIFGHRDLDLTMITGVALLWLRAARGGLTPGWRLCIWVGNNPPLAIDPVRLYDRGGARRDPMTGKRRMLVNMRTFTPALDWDAIAASPPGKAALAVYERAKSAQGPTGLLSRRNVHDYGAEPGSGTAVAWWSPDGGVGLFNGGAS